MCREYWCSGHFSYLCRGSIYVPFLYKICQLFLALSLSVSGHDKHKLKFICQLFSNMVEEQIAFVLVTFNHTSWSIWHNLLMSLLYLFLLSGWSCSSSYTDHLTFWRRGVSSIFRSQLVIINNIWAKACNALWYSKVSVCSLISQCSPHARSTFSTSNIGLAGIELKKSFRIVLFTWDHLVSCGLY